MNKHLVDGVLTAFGIYLVVIGNFFAGVVFFAFGLQYLYRAIASGKDGKDFKMNVWFGMILVIITFASYVISAYAAEQALEIYQSSYTEEVID